MSKSHTTEINITAEYNAGDKKQNSNDPGSQALVGNFTITGVNSPITITNENELDDWRAVYGTNFPGFAPVLALPAGEFFVHFQDADGHWHRSNSADANSKNKALIDGSKDNTFYITVHEFAYYATDYNDRKITINFPTNFVAEHAIELELGYSMPPTSTASTFLNFPPYNGTISIQPIPSDATHNWAKASTTTPPGSSLSVSGSPWQWASHLIHDTYLPLTPASGSTATSNFTLDANNEFTYTTSDFDPLGAGTWPVIKVTYKATPPQKPVQVTNLTATANGDKTVTLSWDAIADADSYTAQYAVVTGGVPGTFTTFAAGVTGNTLTTEAIPNGDYQYRVYATNAQGDGVVSDVVDITMFVLSILNKPTNLRIDSYDFDSADGTLEEVIISWDGALQDVDGNQILFSVYYDNTQLANNINANTYTITDLGAPVNTPITLRVNSDRGADTTTSPSENLVFLVPGQVTILTATANNDQTVTVTWDDVTPVANYDMTYNVYQNNTKVASGLDTTSYTTPKLDSGDYDFSVTVVAKPSSDASAPSFEGNYSPTPPVEVLGELLPPSGITSTFDFNSDESAVDSVNLSWTAVNGANKYYVYVNNNSTGIEIPTNQFVYNPSDDIVFGGSVKFEISAYRNTDNIETDKTVFVFTAELDAGDIGTTLFTSDTTSSPVNGAPTVSVVGTSVVVDVSSVSTSAPALELSDVTSIFTDSGTNAKEIVIESSDENQGVKIKIADQVDTLYEKVTLLREPTVISVDKTSSGENSLVIAEVTPAQPIPINDENGVQVASLTKNNAQTVTYTLDRQNGWLINGTNTLNITEGASATTVQFTKNGEPTFAIDITAINPVILHRLGTNSLTAENLILHDLFDEFVRSNLTTMFPVLNIGACSEAQYNSFLRSASRWAQHNSVNRYNVEVVLQDNTPKVLLHTARNSNSLSNAQSLAGVTPILTSGTFNSSVNNGTHIHSVANLTEFGRRIGINSGNYDGVLILRIIE